MEYVARAVSWIRILRARVVPKLFFGHCFGISMRLPPAFWSRQSKLLLFLYLDVRQNLSKFFVLFFTGRIKSERCFCFSLVDLIHVNDAKTLYFPWFFCQKLKARWPLFVVDIKIQCLQKIPKIWGYFVVDIKPKKGGGLIQDVGCILSWRLHRNGGM